MIGGAAILISRSSGCNNFSDMGFSAFDIINLINSDLPGLNVLNVPSADSIFAS